MLPRRNRRTTMRAAVLYAPKDLRIENVADAALGPREVEVRIEAGGICGSDLHYYFDGGFGTGGAERAIDLRPGDGRDSRPCWRRGGERQSRSASRRKSEPAVWPLPLLPGR